MGPGLWWPTPCARHRMRHLSDPRWINVVTLLLAAAALMLVFTLAPDMFPPVPPGPVLLVAAAGAVALAPGRWTPIAGVLVPAFMIIGGVITGGLVDVLNASPTVVAGSVFQVAALLVAIASGSVTIARRIRPATVATTDGPPPARFAADRAPSHARRPVPEQGRDH